MQSPISIAKATQDDIPSILKINGENLLTNKKHLTKNAIENNGFLITPYTEEMAQSYLNKKESYNLVIKINNEVVAYAFCHHIAEDIHLIEQIADIREWYAILKTHKTLYIAQIAKATDVKGMGNKLMTEIISHAISQQYHYITSLIVHEPICNKPSIKFHEKFKFECVATLPHGDKKAGLYVKKLIS